MSEKYIKEGIYDEIYGGKGYKRKGGLFSWLHSHLKRYEQNRYQTVLKLLERRKRLLDLGCGDGTFCVAAKGIFDEVYGLDVSHVNIMNAKNKVIDRYDKDKFHFTQHDIDAGLQFPNDHFDAVTCIATLECLVDPEHAIREVSRVLKPQGVFVVEVSNFAFLPYRFTLLTGRLPTPFGLGEAGVDWTRLHNFTRKIMTTLLKINRFEVINSTCSGIFARVRRIWPSLVAADIVVKARKRKRTKYEK